MISDPRNELGAPSDDDLLLERLVDGELSGDEYRRFLASLDEQSGGWRRCALAFLEAQALGVELRAAVDDGRSNSPVARPPAARRGIWLPIFAVAASFLLAFGLGILVSGRWPGEVAAPPVVESSTDPASDHPNHLGEETPDASRPRLVEKTPAGDVPLKTVPADVPARGSVTLVIDGAAGEQEVELPLYDASVVDDDWFTAPALPREVLVELQNAGQEVRRSARLVPIDVEGGHRIVVPVEELEIVPIGGEYYQ